MRHLVSIRSAKMYMIDSAPFGKGMDNWRCSQMWGWGWRVAEIDWYNNSG